MRPDISVEEALHRRAIVDPKTIPFLEFDLPASVVAPGCDEDWQKALYVLQLKKLPYDSSAFLIAEAIKFGVLQREDLPGWEPRLNLEDK
jgi:hypothetical protein